MRRLVSWNECTTSQNDLDSPRKIDPRDRSARKRRNLHRGVLRWVRDVCAGDLVAGSRRRRFHRAMLFSLTCATLDPEPARGQMKRLMDDYRHVCPGGRYVWWVETQLRGAIHFHGMLIDPGISNLRRELAAAAGRYASRRPITPAGLGSEPRIASPAAATVDSLDGTGVVRKWLDAHWHLAGIQSWCQWRSADWFRRSAGAYALKDVRKLSGKVYEQKYDNLPVGWRVYARSDLMFTADEHELHEDKCAVRLTFKAVGWSLSGSMPELHEVVPELVSVAKHVPAVGGCQLFRVRPRRRRGARASPASSSRRAGARSRHPPGAALRRSPASPKPSRAEYRPAAAGTLATAR